MTWGEASNIRLQERQSFLTPTRMPAQSPRSEDLPKDYSKFFTPTPPSSKTTTVCPAAPRRNRSHEDGFTWYTPSEGEKAKVHLFELRTLLKLRTIAPKLLCSNRSLVCPANPRRKRIIRYTPSESEESQVPRFEPRTPKRKRRSMKMSLAW